MIKTKPCDDFMSSQGCFLTKRLCFFGISLFFRQAIPPALVLLFVPAIRRIRIDVATPGQVPVGILPAFRIPIAALASQWQGWGVVSHHRFFFFQFIPLYLLCDLGDQLGLVLADQLTASGDELSATSAIVQVEDIFDEVVLIATVIFARLA